MLINQRSEIFLALLVNISPYQPTRRNNLYWPVLCTFMSVQPLLSLWTSPECVLCVPPCAIHVQGAGSAACNSSRFHQKHLQMKLPESKPKGFGFPYQSAISHFQTWILIRIQYSLCETESYLFYDRPYIKSGTKKFSLLAVETVNRVIIFGISNTQRVKHHSVSSSLKLCTMPLKNAFRVQETNQREVFCFSTVFKTILYFLRN